jgi:hypothetical protein
LFRIECRQEYLTLIRSVEHDVSLEINSSFNIEKLPHFVKKGKIQGVNFISVNKVDKIALVINGNFVARRARFFVQKHPKTRSSVSIKFATIQL